MDANPVRPSSESPARLETSPRRSSSIEGNRLQQGAIDFGKLARGHPAHVKSRRIQFVGQFGRRRMGGNAHFIVRIARASPFRTDVPNPAVAMDLVILQHPVGREEAPIGSERESDGAIPRDPDDQRLGLRHERRSLRPQREAIDAMVAPGGGIQALRYSAGNASDSYATMPPGALPVPETIGRVPGSSPSHAVKG